MPIYEYECTKCGVFEQSQRISDAPLAKCPTCRRKVRRLISSTSFQLKGTGWYVTDYARGKNGKGGESKPDTKSDSGSASTSESKSSSKSDAKAGSSTSATTAS